MNGCLHFLSSFNGPCVPIHSTEAMGWEGMMPTVTRDSVDALSERVRYPLANESFGRPKSEAVSSTRAAIATNQFVQSQVSCPVTNVPSATGQAKRYSTHLITLRCTKSVTLARAEGGYVECRWCDSRTLYPAMSIDAILPKDPSVRIQPQK